jgi:pimeloyl-ACP methyl ester carboxylesterase
MAKERFTLSDGRQLGYKQYGDEAGQPVLFFHGSPGSRYEGSLFHKTALANFQSPDINRVSVLS